MYLPHTPILAFAGAMLVLLVLVGLFIFGVYVCTHWSTFVQQTVLLVDGAFLFVGVLSGCAVIAVIGWMVGRALTHRETLKQQQLHRRLIEHLPSIPHNVLAARMDTPYRFLPVQDEQIRYTIRMQGPPLLGTSQENTTVIEQPNLSSLMETLPENTLQFAYGCDSDTGKLLTTTLPAAVHLQLIGSTGQGKSRQAQSILYQLTSKNTPSRLQLALIDCEQETTAPFTALPHVRYRASEYRAAAHTLRQLVGELERRDRLVALQQHTRATFPMLLVFCEEFLLLYRTLPQVLRDQALEDYTTLALRGRKRHLYLFSIGQSAYTEKPIRDAQLQFLSNMAFALKPTAARSAGFRNTELLNRLYEEKRVGQFLLERGSGDHLVLSPYVPDTLLTGCSSSGERETDDVLPPCKDETTRQQHAGHMPDDMSAGVAQDARRARVRELHTQGAGKQEIIKDVWGITPGTSKAYKAAQAEYVTIMQQLMARIPGGEEV